MYKFFSIAVMVIATAILAHKAHVSYYHKGCQIRVRRYRITERPALIGISLFLLATVGAAFWAELSKLANIMTYFEEVDVILFNVTTLLLLAWGYYTVTRKMITKLQENSRINAQCDAKSQILRCKLCCHNAPAGEDSRLHCRNHSVLVCPCAKEWDVRTQASIYDVRAAVRKAEMLEFGATEIGVPASRIVRKDAKDAGLSAAVEQAYIGQIVRLIATKMPNGSIQRELRDEPVETFRVR